MTLTSHLDWVLATLAPLADWINAGHELAAPLYLLAAWALMCWPLLAMLAACVVAIHVISYREQRRAIRRRLGLLAPTYTTGARD